MLDKLVMLEFFILEKALDLLIVVMVKTFLYITLKFMTILKLDPKDYQGREFVLKYSTTGYYDIEKLEEGFQITYKKFDTVTEMSFKDKFFNDWLEEPVAYGAFEGEKLLGYVEGTLEKWNNRYRISNICVFEKEARRCGIGTQLMNIILEAICYLKIYQCL